MIKELQIKNRRILKKNRKHKTQQLQYTQQEQKQNIPQPQTT